MSANAFAIALGNHDKNPTIGAVAQAIPDKILEKAIPQKQFLMVRNCLINQGDPQLYE